MEKQLQIINTSRLGRQKKSSRKKKIIRKSSKKKTKPVSQKVNEF